MLDFVKQNKIVNEPSGMRRTDWESSSDIKSNAFRLRRGLILNM